MAIRLNELYGIDPTLAAAIEATGLDSSNKFLRLAALPDNRRVVAAKLGTSEAEVLRLAHRADLARIDGVGRIYSDLLELSGIRTVAQLRTQNVRNLHAIVIAVAQQYHVRRVPNRATVEDWIEQAQALPQAIFQ